MTFKPIHDHILIRPKKMHEKAASDPAESIADQRSQSGTVVSTGNGISTDDGMTHPLDVRMGDQVVFAEGAGTEVKLKGETLIVLKEGEVLGTL